MPESQAWFLQQKTRKASRKPSNASGGSHPGNPAVSWHANVLFEASICRLVSRFTNGTQNYCQSDWSFFISPCSENVLNFFQKQTSDSYCFISELMDAFFMAGVHQQPGQSNYLAEGQT